MKKCDEFRYGFRCSLKYAAEKELYAPSLELVYATLLLSSKVLDKVISYDYQRYCLFPTTSKIFCVSLTLAFLTPALLVFILGLIVTLTIISISSFIGAINGTINACTRTTPKPHEALAISLNFTLKQFVDGIFRISQDTTKEKINAIHYVVNLIGNNYQQRKYGTKSWLFKQSNSSAIIFDLLKKVNRSIIQDQYEEKDSHLIVRQNCNNLATHLLVYLRDERNANKALFKSFCSGINQYNTYLDQIKTDVLNKVGESLGNDIVKNIVNMSR